MKKLTFFVLCLALLIAPLASADVNRPVLTRALADALYSQLGHTHTLASTTGSFTTPAYDASQFTASGTMTWGVDAGDVVTRSYALIGTKLLLLTWVIQATDVGGVASNALRLALPVGVSAKQANCFQIYYDAGGAAAQGFCSVSAGGTYVELFKAGGASWTLTSADNTRVQGFALIEIQ